MKLFIHTKMCHLKTNIIYAHLFENMPEIFCCKMHNIKKKSKHKIVKIEISLCRHIIRRSKFNSLSSLYVYKPVNS